MTKELSIIMHSQIVALDEKHRMRPKLVWDRRRGFIGEVRDHHLDKCRALEAALDIMENKPLDIKGLLISKC